MKTVEIGDRIVYQGEAFFITEYLDIDHEPIAEAEFAEHVTAKSAKNTWICIPVEYLRWKQSNA